MQIKNHYLGMCSSRHLYNVLLIERYEGINEMNMSFISSSPAQSFISILLLTNVCILIIKAAGEKAYRLYELSLLAFVLNKFDL